MYTQPVLWRKKSSSSLNPGMDATESGGEEEVLDLDDELDADDEDLTPAEAEALADLAQRVATGETELHFNARIELLDGDGRVVESHPIGGPTAPRPHYAGPRLDLPSSLSAGRALGAEGFVAIDFETATGSRASACAVAVAVVECGHVEDVQRWLIQPPGNEYDGFNISIHGITPAMTEDSPNMAAVWPEVLAAVGDRPLAAHYAAFDMSVLRNALTARESEWPNLTYFCTCTLAKRAWPGMLSYRLVDLADECGLAFQHHDPGADAATAAELAIACCGLASERRLDDASKALGVRAGQLSSDGWMPSGMVPRHLSDLTPTVDHIPEDAPFVGKTVVFTGTLTSGLTRTQAAQLVVDAGGHVAAGVSKKVNYLVLGMQDARRVKDGNHSGKMLKAIELQRAGAPVELLSENDFLRMLPD
jgi:DNA polymerase III subunit epsilon